MRRTTGTGRGIWRSATTITPRIAWLIRSSTLLWSPSEFWVRFWWAVFGIALVALAYDLGSRAGGRSGGMLVALLVLVGPPFVARSALATPDGLALFWWAATLAALQRALAGSRYREWVLCGLAFGCGLESKYTVVLLLPAILLAMLATARGRWWLGRPAPYAAAAVAALVFAPNVLWNATHGWVTMSFQLAHGQAQAPSGMALWDQIQAYLWACRQVSSCRSGLWSLAWASWPRSRSDCAAAIPC